MIEKTDVTAYRLDEAVNILERKGIKFKLKTAVSPFPDLVTQGGDELLFKRCRVVKQVKLAGPCLELTIVLVDQK